MILEEFKELVRKKRTEIMLTPAELTYISFTELGYDEKDKQFFIDNASLIVKELRRESWEQFLIEESRFSQYIYSILINKSSFNGLSKKESIKQFLNKYSLHIYALALSNTQSRRSRAGTEFEFIIELILMGVDISIDTQGSVGTGVFESIHLAKLVDCVAPGATEYKLDKRNTSLISAKTTLRERWQEVGDEMSRTMAREMYLATLDDRISMNKAETIGLNNIILVTLQEYKDTIYNEMVNVISFEDMIQELITKELAWKNYQYEKNDLEEKEQRYKKQVEKYENQPFVKKYYKNKIYELKNN